MDLLAAPPASLVLVLAGTLMDTHARTLENTDTGAVAGTTIALASWSASMFQSTMGKRSSATTAVSRRPKGRRRRSPAASSSSRRAFVAGDGDSAGLGVLATPDFASESQHLLNLLYSIAEDQARREGYVHRGISCNHCNATPIRGIRFKCANCIDYDLCEACEALEPHLPRTHVFIKIRIPIPPLANPRTTLTPVLYPGIGRALNDTVLSWDDLRELQRKTHFDHIELEALYDQFKSLAGPSGISWRLFEHCLGPLGLERNLITERIFKFFDQDGDDIINFSELVCGLSILCKGTQEEKIQYIFKGYDLDDDGYISMGDLEKMFRAYFQLTLDLIKDMAQALQEEIVLRYDLDSDKPVSAAFGVSIPNEDGRKISKPSTPAPSLDTTMDHIEHAPLTDPASATNTGAFRWPTPQQVRPVMEALSDEAISELVQRTFRGADPSGTGLISFDAFRRVAMADPTVTAWFESLGTVF